ncbi:MAG: hypothetical protein Q7T16_02315 [Candidatus Burarchaeum sp.]|nr:hypothetical protein [Candidatus Burarchaeum sp.]MDO8339468.1 hypothetical protein [Candidatus Burarchaeum sp.]
MIGKTRAGKGVEIKSNSLGIEISLKQVKQLQKYLQVHRQCWEGCEDTADIQLMALPKSICGKNWFVRCRLCRLHPKKSAAFVVGNLKKLLEFAVKHGHGRYSLYYGWSSIIDGCSIKCKKCGKELDVTPYEKG